MYLDKNMFNAFMMIGISGTKQYFYLQQIKFYTNDKLVNQ